MKTIRKNGKVFIWVIQSYITVTYAVNTYVWHVRMYKSYRQLFSKIIRIILKPSPGSCFFLCHVKDVLLFGLPARKTNGFSVLLRTENVGTLEKDPQYLPQDLPPQEGEQSAEARRGAAGHRARGEGAGFEGPLAEVTLS